MLELSIIIVNWNSADYVLKCIQTIKEQTLDTDYEIIVVDNASFDGCRDRLSDLHPDVIFIQSQYNLGFARGNNLGAKYASGSVLLFLNPDTEVRNNAIDRLFRCIQSLPDSGALGGKLLNSDGSIQTSCVQPFPTILNQLLDAEIFRHWFPHSKLWGNRAIFENVNGPVEVEVISGACLMIKHEVFDIINAFSTDYFMYSEDLDLCFKTQKVGLRNYYCGEAVIIHHGGGSSRRSINKFSAVMMCESVSRFLRKWRGSSYANSYRCAMTMSATLRLTFLLLMSARYLDRRKRETFRNAITKWFAILRWSIGLEKWVKEYDRLDMPTSDIIGSAD
ncbi:MAG: glycosyltransferase family 2 protein [Deltaproteobacteria bacterium]|nr:glycosyltransferase family 2 protein [Deltaproteobacteria bacterium]MBW2024934.1 glycosyltransferase family 2 protein [Deltaproteobacteria bacterium]MBW2124963.1 glycosyltransferase family 2 protein [Deltaproteobacteria bacterium]